MGKSLFRDDLVSRFHATYRSATRTRSPFLRIFEEASTAELDGEVEATVVSLGAAGGGCSAGRPVIGIAWSAFVFVSAMVMSTIDRGTRFVFQT